MCMFIYLRDDWIYQIGIEAMDLLFENKYFSRTIVNMQTICCEMRTGDKIDIERQRKETHFLQVLICSYLCTNLYSVY